MKMIVAAALIATGPPIAASTEASAVDDIIRKLDLTSFANSIGARRVPEKTTFADYGFVTVEKTMNSVRLLRKDDGRSKSFAVLSNGPKFIRLCFHDKFVVMPGSVSPIRYYTTLALVVTKSQRGMWTAQSVPGGFLNCRNDPPAPYAGVPPQG